MHKKSADKRNIYYTVGIVILIVAVTVSFAIIIYNVQESKILLLEQLTKDYLDEISKNVELTMMISDLSTVIMSMKHLLIADTQLREAMNLLELSEVLVESGNVSLAKAYAVRAQEAISNSINEFEEVKRIVSSSKVEKGLIKDVGATLIDVSSKGVEILEDLLKCSKIIINADEDNIPYTVSEVSRIMLDVKVKVFEYERLMEKLGEKIEIPKESVVEDFKDLEKKIEKLKEVLQELQRQN